MARHLLEAICSGNEALAKEIVLAGQHGCIDSQTSRRDGTALFFCCSRGHLELAKLLIQAGASLEARTRFSATPLHAAVDNNHTEIVRYLITLGADVNAQTHRGDTPLHLATYRGYMDIVQLLVQFGADVTLTNESSLTPLHEAVRQGYCGIEHYLMAVQELHYPRKEPAPSSHMVVLDPPTDLPSLLPSQYPPSEEPTPVSKDTLSSTRLRSHNLAFESPDITRDLTRIPCLNDNSVSKANTAVSFTPVLDETSTLRDTFLTQSSLRAPEESLDPSLFLSLAVSSLPVPSLEQNSQSRTSSDSSLSLLSDCINSGPRSEEGSAMSSISDVSSCGGDARREDFEATELDGGTGSCRLIHERRKSQPLSSIPLEHCFLSRTYSNPAPSSAGEFSDLYNSSQFSMGSLGSPIFSKDTTGDDHIMKVSTTVSGAKYPLLSSKCLPEQINDLRENMVTNHTVKKDMISYECFNATKMDQGVPSLQLTNSVFLPTVEDCLNKNSDSLENQASNDLSSIKSSPSSPVPSMTFLNIPIQK